MCSIYRGGHQSLNQIGRLVGRVSAPLGHRAAVLIWRVEGRVIVFLSVSLFMCSWRTKKKVWGKKRSGKRSSPLTLTCPCGRPSLCCWLVSQPRPYQRSQGLSWWISVHLSAKHRTKGTNTSLRSKVNPSGAQRSVKTLQNDNTLTLGSVVSWLLDLVELTFIILVQQASQYLNKPAVT